jgi:hypothetical protein
MKRIIFSILLTAFAFQAFTQDTLFRKASSPLKKPAFHVMAGTSFTTSSGYGSALQSFITPSITYPVAKRWTIGGGISFLTTNYFNARPYYGEQSSSYSGNYTSAILFVNTHYQVTDRFSITGSGYKEIPISGEPYPYSSYLNTGKSRMQGIDLNLQYRLGEHVFIQAGFGYHEGRYPGYYDPFAPTSAGFMQPGPWGANPSW